MTSKSEQLHESLVITSLKEDERRVKINLKSIRLFAEICQI